MRPNFDKKQHESMDALLAEINSNNNIKESSLKEHRDSDCSVREFCELPNCMNCRRLK